MDTIAQVSLCMITVNVESPIECSIRNQLCHNIIYQVFLPQILMNVRQTTHVMSMQTVMILMAATGVSAGKDSWEMDTTAQVQINLMHNHCVYMAFYRH